MGKINLNLFEKIFGDGNLDVKVKPRHFMKNPTIKHEDKKRQKARKECRKFKQINQDDE